MPEHELMNAKFNAAGLSVFERGWLSSNNVLFDDGGRTESVMIDSGYCSHATQTTALVKNTLGERPLARVVNTHLHSDHCGGNVALQQAFGSAILIPAGEQWKVEAWDEAALTYRDTGQHCPPFQYSGVLKHGDEIQCGTHRWKVIAAPGHDPEAIVLYQAELKLLISADALWQNGFGVVFPELEGLDAFDDVRSTLAQLSALKVDFVIPGHGPPFGDFHAAIDRAHQRLESFVSNPVRHARYAAKVLIKFHMLELQETSLDQLVDWANMTRYLQLTYERYFKSTLFRAWYFDLLTDLKKSGAIRIDDRIVKNT